jgi:uncharacterized protein YbaR (Trm112 family)
MKKISCPYCHNDFSINENKALKPKTVFDGFAQLTTFDMVACPFCKKSFQAPDAKLFGYFKSPFAVIGLGLLFVSILFFLNLFFKNGF